METLYAKGGKVMVSPKITGYLCWEEGTISEIKGNSYIDTILTVEMQNGEVFSGIADSFYFKHEVLPFFVKPKKAEFDDYELNCFYDYFATEAISGINNIIRSMLGYHDVMSEYGDAESPITYLEQINKILLKQKENSKGLIMLERMVHGETQYDLGKQAMLVMRNKIIKLLYNLEVSLQQELGLLKLKKDGTSYVKGMDFVEPEVYIPHAFCDDFTVEYTMYLGETADGKENLCTLLLRFKAYADSPSIFYNQDGGLLICGGNVMKLEKNITYNCLKSYIQHLPLIEQSECFKSAIEEYFPIFIPLGEEIASVMIEYNDMIRDKKYQLFEPIPLVKMQSIMENPDVKSLYLEELSKNVHNEQIKDSKKQEILALKKRYKELYTLLHETMVDPYDYVDIMIEYGKVQCKLNQLGENKYQSKWVVI